MSVTWKYLHAFSAGPLIIARIPEPQPRWREVLKALTPVMREHGLRQKDISSIEAVIGDPPETDASLLSKLESAFDGGAELPAFWLYEWRTDGFVLVRSALKVA